MGRRPRFCPPLLSNRCARMVAQHSSPPLVGSKPSAACEVRLACLSTVAAHHIDSSSPSPRVTKDELNVHGGVLRSKKKKSPIPVFRSPLSKMLMSPRVQALGARLRSPSMGHVDRDTEIEVVQDTVDALDQGTRVEVVQDTVSALDQGTRVELGEDIVDALDQDSEVEVVQVTMDAQGGLLRSRKRKSSCVRIPVFISPLSRMLISPRVQVLGTQFRSPSPSVVHVDQDSEIELVHGTEAEFVQDTVDALDEDTQVELVHGYTVYS